MRIEQELQQQQPAAEKVTKAAAAAAKADADPAFHAVRLWCSRPYA